MAKKLQVELEVDNSDAKKKAKEVAEAANEPVARPEARVPAPSAATLVSGMPVSPVAPPEPVKIPVEPPKPVKIPVEPPKPVKIPVEPPSGGPDEAARAARSLKELSNGAREASVNMRAAVKAFAGMGIGLATSYAQAMMEPGSTGQRAVGYIGAMASGAMMGSVAGPWGSAAGAGLGLIKEGFNQSAQDKAAEKSKDDQLRSIREWERAREQTLAFKETLEQLTTEGGDAKEKMAALTAEIEKRKEIDANLANTQRHAVATGNAAMLAEATAFRSRNAGQIDALGAALKQMEKQKTGGGASWNGVDALTSVGGMFAGSGAGARAVEEIAASTAETVKVLKEIERNTDNGGGATWQ